MIPQGSFSLCEIDSGAFLAKIFKGSSNRNKRHPRIVAAACTHSTGTCALKIKIPANAPTKTVRVLPRLVFMADIRTERLCVLLPVSIRHGCITRMYMYLIQPLLLSAEQILVRPWLEWLPQP